MLQKNPVRKKLRPRHLLTGLFLAYIFFVGLAGLPQFLYHVGRCAYWKTGIPHFIESVDTQYESMLETDKYLPAVQDKGSYIDLNGLMSRALGQPMMNTVVKLKNGHLTTLVSEEPEQERIRYVAENLTRFCRKQQEMGKHFLFVMAPSQLSSYEDLLPTGYVDTTNDTADQVLALLEENHVPCLDLRQQLQLEGISTTEAFYTSDHHWLPQTGFWAYGQIVRKLEALGAVEALDPYYTDMQNYSFQTYPDTFLGSWGKRVGVHYAGVDDSIFIRPDFPTEISITLNAGETALQGRYEEVGYHTGVSPDYDNPDFYRENAYGLYGWGDTDLTQWRNPQAPVAEKLLLIGDSFGNVPYSLMSIGYSSCDEMDMRHYEGDFGDYYAQYDPDTVVILVTATMTISENTEHPYFPAEETP